MVATRHKGKREEERNKERKIETEGGRKKEEEKARMRKREDLYNVLFFSFLGGTFSGNSVLRGTQSFYATLHINIFC